MELLPFLHGLLSALLSSVSYPGLSVGLVLANPVVHVACYAIPVHLQFQPILPHLIKGCFQVDPICDGMLFYLGGHPQLLVLCR